MNLCVRACAHVRTHRLLVEGEVDDATTVALLNHFLQIIDLHRRGHAFGEVHHPPDYATHRDRQEGADGLADHERLIRHLHRLPRVLLGSAFFATTSSSLSFALLRHRAGAEEALRNARAGGWLRGTLCG